MNINCLDKLDFYRILDILSGFTKTYVGKKLILDLRPSFNVLEVSNMLMQTFQALDIINKFGNPPTDEFNDVSIHLKKLEGGSTLSAKEILDLAHVLKMSREIFSFFDNTTETLKLDFPMLKSFFLNLYSNIDLEKEIFLKIIDENTIDDKASDTLYSIRKNKKKLEQDIKDKLWSFIHSATYSKYLMEPIITIRDNRYVIPVKDEYRSQISGLIHDISSSGSTVFIEPTSIFDINNEINTLKIKENIEIEKILFSLTSKLSAYISELENNVRLIGLIDFIFAKANYAKSINGICPTISDKKEFNLINARHPLIDKSKVVPIDISLGNSYSTLVITGPNTGGKTASLKTVGLLHLMAYSGILIPANENSSIYVFDNIFADIGDDQSIAESLSTFSSHMKNIIDITNEATCQSLILVDELGSGTDPVEGSSLAISILEFFNNLGSLCISTTHYQEIKNFALTHDGYINASAEFDIENLKPTYHIILGIPGKSNAFAISQKLGLNNKILDRAKSLINSNDVKIEDVLKNIYDNQKQIESEKEKIELNSKEIEALKKELQKDNTAVKNKEKEIIENAKIEARDILLKAKDDATSIIRKMNDISDSSKNIKDLNNLRNNLNNSIRSLNNFENDKINKGNLTESDLSKGTKVIITNLNQKGIVIGQVKNNKVQVQIGNSKLNVDITNLELDFTKEENKKTFSKSSTANLVNKTVSPEINVIGLNVDEAVPIIDKYLDNCYVSSLNNVRIVHGKGTGKLRQGIHSFLKKNSHVKSFRLGTFGEGETGVTVVELKK